MNDAAYKELTSYTDQELAHFVTGRLPHLDAGLQRDISYYVQQVRKLNKENILPLVARKIPRGRFWESRCSRCGSSRLEREEYKKSCLVCGRSATRNELLKVLRFIGAFFQGGW